MAPRIPLFHLTSVLVALLAFGLITAPQAPAAPPPRGLDELQRPLEPAPVVAQAPRSSDDARLALARAAAQRSVAERELAVATLLPFVEHWDPAIATEVAYGVALLRLELGYPREAAGALENLVAGSPRSAVTDRAAFLLGVARRQAGDCPGSIAAFSEYAARSSLLAPNVALQLATCYEQLGDTAAAFARTEEALQSGSPRLLRIDALERQASLLEKAGDKAGALARWEQLAELARTTSYKAETRLAAARLSQELGREADAIAHLVAAVNDAPTVRGGKLALDRLVELGGQDQVSYLSAGLVRYWNGEYVAAARNFEGALATPSEAGFHPAAAYYRAVSRVRQGAEIEGARELLALPGAYPSSRWAPDALLRGAKVLESNGQYGEAAGGYARLANDYPNAPNAAEALFRLGLSHLLRGAPAEAAAAWARLGGSDADAAYRTLGLLWLGKLEAQAGDLGSAYARWQQALDLGPTWYGGLRARGLLDGQPGVLNGGVALDPSRAEISPAELAELSAWTAERGAALDAILAEQAADPAMVRADELLALGLKTDAAWEFDDLSSRAAADPARLAGLALALQQRGLPYQALRQALASLDAARISVRQGPTALQKLYYPLPYAETVQAQGQKHGVDPLLFAALIWQESKFDHEARSSANARGLTQVVPSTGQEIANALGRSGWVLEDLYKPAVSLEFGAYYFGQRLRRFDGVVFPALAGYNAGEGAAQRWIREFGLDDLDLYAERIPYAETNYYVRIIYETYGLYRALYGAR